MKKQIILLIAILFLPLIVVGDDCYTRTRQKAIDAYNRCEYDYAKDLFQSVKEDCIETPTNNDIDSWINKCSSAKREQIKREQAQKRNIDSKDYSKGKTHEYVDLELSVKWATCNIGADRPEDYGDYFAWGEVNPMKRNDFLDYKFGRLDRGIDYVTKYCTNGQYGIVDNKIILDIEDDAAYINWGDSWRMPTQIELDELINNCTWIWIQQNGVNGYKVTGVNGNSIFLPAAGFINGNDTIKVGEEIYYWSNSLRTDVTYNSASFMSCYLHKGSTKLIGRSRYNGLSIRPVCK